MGFAGLFLLALAIITVKVRDVERALAYVLLLLYTLVSSLFPWYFNPIIGLLALKHNRTELLYLFAASSLALISYPLSIWARSYTGLSLFQMRLIMAVPMTLPIVGLFALLIGRWGIATLLQPAPSRPQLEAAIAEEL